MYKLKKKEKVHLTEAEKKIELQKKRQFQQLVYQQWDGKCYICGKIATRKEVDIHHKRGSWAPLDRFNPQNGVVTHITCHQLFHSFYDHKRCSPWMLREFILEKYPQNVSSIKQLT